MKRKRERGGKRRDRKISKRGKENRESDEAGEEQWGR